MSYRFWVCMSDYITSASTESQSSFIRGRGMTVSSQFAAKTAEMISLTQAVCSNITTEFCVSLLV